MKSDIRRAAINLLARRDYSRVELLTRFTRRFGNDESTRALIDEVLAQLAAEGLQDDMRFAASFVRYRKQQGKGPRRIAMDLQTKGISGVALDEGAGSWLEQARMVHCKRFGETAPVDASDYGKRLRFLLYRGFDPGIARQVIARPRRDDNPENIE